MSQIRDEILLKKIALGVKKLREEKKLSQEDLYIATDINITRIESAKVNISVSTLSSLCKYFEISLSQFFKKIDN